MDFDSMPDETQAASAPTSEALPSFDAIPAETSQPKAITAPGQLNFDTMSADAPAPSHDSPSQKALTGVEGFARQFVPFSDAIFRGARGLAEEYSSDPDFWAPKMSDMAARQEENSVISHGAEVAGATIGAIKSLGLSGLVSKGATKAAEAVIPKSIPYFTKLGTLAVKGALEAGAYQANDELSRAMLGQDDDKDAAAAASSALAHIGAAGLFGGATGLTFGAAGMVGSKGLDLIKNARMGDKLGAVTAGMGLGKAAQEAGVPAKEAADYIEEQMRIHDPMGLDFNVKPYETGIKIYYDGAKRVADKVVDAVTDTAAAYGAQKLSDIPGAATGMAMFSQKYIAPWMEKIVERPLIGMNKFVMPIVLNAMSKGQTNGLYDALNHGEQVARGAKAIGSGIESLFKAGGQQIINATDRDKEKISNAIDKGGIEQDYPEQPPGFAKGGIVPAQPTPVSSLYPQQAQLMTAAKARISNYLTSLKPQQQPQSLPFDRPMPLKDQERAYGKALHLAAAPLTILNKIKDGSLQSEDIRHMNGMYPELAQHLQQKITSRMTQAKIDDEPIKPHTKQAMAIFLGVPLTGYQTPMGIQLAQATMAPKQTPQQGEQQGKTKKGTSTLGKSNKSYKTATQEAESDRSSRD